MLPTTGRCVPAVSLQNPRKALSSFFKFTKSLALTKQLHAQLILYGFQLSVPFGSKISKAYIDMGSLESAFKVFDAIPFKSPHSWNTIISGYSKNKRFYDVLCLYKRFRSGNSQVDSFNLVFAIKACVGLSLIQMGKSLHSEVIKWGWEIDSYVSPALMNMYIELGCSLEDTQKVFEGISERNSIIWGVMMKGYLNFSKESKVFELFRQMRWSGCELEPFSLEILIRASGNSGASGDGNSLHGYCIKRNFFKSNYCLHTSIVDMYMKCGFLGLAIKFFEEMGEKDVVLWSKMVDGFTKNGKAREAISVFQKMLEDSTMPNAITLASVFQACSQLGALQQGKGVHGFAIRNGIELDVVSYTTLVDMYARCGVIEVAQRVFSVMPKRNVFSWSVMINGFAIHGLYSEAFDSFDLMRSENHKPNSITFVSILSACSHSGRVEEGWFYFELMSRNYGITPVEEHYACMVDLLGRVGKIDKAEAFISKMPVEPGAIVWGALLSACRIHKRVELAEKIAKKLLLCEPDQSSVYVLLSNIYAMTGMWEMVKKMRSMMREKSIQKIVGFSSVEINKKVYVFSAKDTRAYMNMRVEGLWNVLGEDMGALGYMPNTSFLLNDADAAEVKGEMLRGHG